MSVVQSASWNLEIILITKPIFHCKLGLRWVTNANKFCVEYPTRPIFHLFALGVCAGGNTNFSVRIGGNAYLAFYMLVSPTQNSCIGGIAQRDGQTRVFSRRSGIKALEVL